ncbi:MFS transporter [Rhodophyticola sp. CCM32]|uniref:MFS transporter n=1 Tax=Rhodophyticola sp. CCM32 TaxID=2916397 RepID=UPI00107FB251|nr:MFS transporter [Rhodophyticola sp. CCM32]QBY01691.1 MFS transporter [Rhodophyticola sp. CCM32]
MGRFFSENRRWLVTGLLLTFGSSFGQTWFISLFAGEIRAEYGLSDGQWGALYTFATLSSALLLLSRGSLADTMAFSRLVPLVAGMFALAAVAMAFGNTIWVLGIAVFLLRFCGQGMFGHIAATAMGRWFVATRGRAVAITNLGYPMGEMVLPLAVVLLIGGIGWRETWAVTAGGIVLVLLPALILLLAEDRTPSGMTVTTDETAGLEGRHWTRGQVLRHGLFLALIPLILTPGFIGTVVFFHQVHVAGIKGWTLTQMAPAYPVFASVTVVTSLVSGWAMDRFGADRFLPVTLIPMGVAMFLIGPAESPWHWVSALGIMALTQGMTGTLWGAFLPMIYGTAHLGSVRAIVTALMVFATAIGPGLTGLLIDWGIPFPDQGMAMGLWCLALAAVMLPVSLRLRSAL